MNVKDHPTRRKLIEAGFVLFGELGFEAASTRALAAKAGANIGAIAYHFGGKEGLRLACAQDVVIQLSGIIQDAPKIQSHSPSQAQQVLENRLSAITQFYITSEGVDALIRFVFREIHERGEVFDHLYTHLFKPTHSQVCRLWAQATEQDEESPQVRLQVFTLLAQIVYFRIGQPIIVRRMEWTCIGKTEAEAILSIILINLRCMIAAHRVSS